MGPVFFALLWVVIVVLILYGFNAIAMYGAFTRATPTVAGSAVYADRAIDVYLQVDGHVHGAEVIEVVMDKQQAARCDATAPVGFTFIDTDWPLCPLDRVVFVPFRLIPLREHSFGRERGFGAGHFILWCGRRRIRHGPPQLIRIPCQRSLDEPPRIGIRYRYRVGSLMAEEYVGISTDECLIRHASNISPSR